jgi:hypothetical protein
VTKATLHDELMREAGFESDYHVELARRRKERRRKLKVDLLRAVRVLAVVGVLFSIAAWLVVDVFGASAGVSRARILVTEIAFVVGLAADLLLDRMRGEGEPTGLLRRVFWRCGRVVVRAGKRVAHRRGSEA